MLTISIITYSQLNQINDVRCFDLTFSEVTAIEIVITFIDLSALSFIFINFFIVKLNIDYQGRYKLSLKKIIPWELNIKLVSFIFK